MSLLFARMMLKNPGYDGLAFFLKDSEERFHTDSSLVPSWYSLDGLLTGYFFCYHGVYHNLDGPAIVKEHIGVQYYYVMGKQYATELLWQAAVKEYKNGLYRLQ